MQSMPSLTGGRDAATTVETPEPLSKKPYKVGSVTLLSPSGDSDKENWSPGENGNPHRRHPFSENPAKAVEASADNSSSNHLRHMGRVLGEQNGLHSSKTPLANNSSRANASAMIPRNRGGGKHAGGSPLTIFEDREKGRRSREGTPDWRGGGDRRDTEVERFMRGEISPSKKPDMDCIAGLLSLSQGNWR